MNLTVLILTSNTFEMNNRTGYIIGAAIALVILGYLLYSLVKPERF